MNEGPRYRAIVLALSAFLVIFSASTLLARSAIADSPTDVRDIVVGAFTVEVPSNWAAFNTNEVAELHRQYLVQSEEIYRQFSGSNDPSQTVDVVAFHILNGAGTFVVVSFTVPPQSDLIALLESQADEKAAWGVREGYIRKYLGFVPVENERLAGFYTKAIGNNGRVEISGGLEHKKLKNTIIQLTLLCPRAWDEVEAVNQLSPIINSVMLREK